jgi:DNA mismatch repair protein MutL
MNPDQTIITIHHLSPATIALIAAGEVIERPASVVKELIDNAIDAGASEVTVELESGGSELIRVTDNGVGMTAADLALSIERHTTSKLSTADQLAHLSSLGFRGEALASIAAVAQLTVESRTASQSHGYTITVPDQTEPKPVGMAPGTRITVRHLFANLPARRKFLKSPLTELRAILVLISHYALTYPHLSWRVFHQHQLVLHFATHHDLLARASKVLGQPVAHHLVPVHFLDDQVQVTGLVGAPQLARSSTSHQYLSVNGRPVTSNLLSGALRRAYAHTINKTHHPIAIINLVVPPDQFDPNVHPRKETVSFHDELSTRDILTKIVRQTLRSPQPQLELIAQTKVGESVPLARLSHRHSDTQLKTALSERVKAWLPTQSGTSPTISQLANTYLIFPLDHELLILDQHAAHERILYHQYWTQLSQQQLEPIQLDQPWTMTITPWESSILEEQSAIFEKLGFELTPLGQDTIRVSQLPSPLSTEHAQELIHGLLDDLHSNQELSETPEVLERTVASLACKSAIKAGDPVDAEAARRLLEKLLLTPHYHTCPHGRPTHFLLTVAELETIFRRR